MRSTRTAGLVLALTIATSCATEADEQTRADLRASSTSTTEAVRSTDRPSTTTTAPTTTEAPTTTTAPLPGFGAGTQLVGTDMQPGRYTSHGAHCYWERLAGLSGDFDDIIVNGNSEAQAIVEIVPGDVAFNSSGCGRWTIYQPPAAPVSEFGPGDWVVGEQILPGTYRSGGELCYWERASGFTHDFGEIVTNAVPEGQAVVEIPPGDVRFTSVGCGTWSPI